MLAAACLFVALPYGVDEAFCFRSQRVRCSPEQPDQSGTLNEVASRKAANNSAIDRSLFAHVRRQSHDDWPAAVARNHVVAGQPVAAVGGPTFAPHRSWRLRKPEDVGPLDRHSQRASKLAARSAPDDLPRFGANAGNEPPSRGRWPDRAAIVSSIATICRCEDKAASTPMRAWKSIAQRWLASSKMGRDVLDSLAAALGR